MVPTTIAVAAGSFTRWEGSFGMLGKRGNLMVPDLHP
jgi:hypothetical protein